MMGSTMHYYKKYSVYLIGLIISMCLLMPTIAQAEKPQNLKIVNANFIESKQAYRLFTEVNITFAQAVRNALKKGFELSFIQEFQLLKPRKYWFDDEIITIVRPITLSYHALSRQYLLMVAGQQQTFSSLEAVKSAFAHLEPEPVFHHNILDKAIRYRAVVLFRLDYKKLPNDLQSEADDLDDWHLTSQRYEWTPLFFK